MVGRMATAHPCRWQLGPSVVPPVGGPHAQVHHTVVVQKIHLAGLHQQ
uniref:Uncharacterized protein n=1 Tax=Arundo donax TaxID=35708 RepID=A0A0A9FP32_ARUDO